MARIKVKMIYHKRKDGNAVGTLYRKTKKICVRDENGNIKKILIRIV